MKKNKKEIKLLKALAFPVSAWFLFTIGTTAIHAQETNVSNVENTPQTVETTDSIDSSWNENTELNTKDKTMDDYWEWANQNIGTSNAGSSEQAKTDSVTYETHVQDIGWQKPKKDGEVAGTTGQSKRVEAIDIKLDSQYEGNVLYQAHVQDIGWQDTVENGAIAGTSGQSKRVEALRVWLTGDIANHYSIQYRVHVSNLGWLDWVSDGMLSGTTGRGLKIEGVQIRLSDLTNKELIQYTTHVQDIGWQGQITSGQIAGTTGQSKRIEGIRVYYNDAQYGGSIQYQAHVQDIGWQAVVSNGNLAGTTNQSKRVEAIRFMLEGEVAQYFDIYYRVHVSDYGWLDWASNGEIAGTTGHSKKIEAIQIQLVEKGKTLNTGGISSIQKNVSYIDNKVATGWMSINGKKVYFNSKGEKLTGYQTIDGKTYCFNSDGTLLTNTWTGTERSDCNYADANGVVTKTHAWILNKKVEYVVDREAYDALEPIYSMVAHDICNNCGEDITDCVIEHNKTEILAGTGKYGWRTEWMSEITGYETVHHDEEGHYEETILSKVCLRCGARE